MPTSKAKTVTFNREWKSPQNHMIYYFDIEFEDGTVGQFSTNKKDQNKFLPGVEVEYTVEPKSSGKGDWNKIDKVKSDEGAKAVPSKKWSRDPKVRKLIIAQTAVKCAIETLELETPANGKMVVLKDRIQSPGDILNIAAKYNKFIIENAGGNEQLEIILQGQVHNAINSAVAPALAVNSSDRVLEIAKEFRDGILKIANLEGDNEL
jgi:hypothetical protein